MYFKLIERLKTILKSIFGKNPREFRVVVLCIIGATTFWFLNALNKNYTTTVAYPIEFEYDREAFVPTQKLPEEVEIQVSGQGWDLFWENFSSYNRPLEFTLDNIPGKILIKKWELEKAFNDDQHSINLEQALTDELLFEINEIQSREVYIGVDSSKISFSNGFGQASTIKISPSSVLFKGPSTTIESLPDTLWLPIREQKLSDDYEEEIEIGEQLKYYRLENNAPSGAISVSFRVDELIVKQFQIPVQIKNYNLEDSLYLFPEKFIQLSCKIPERLEVSPGDFLITIDVDSQRFDMDTILPIQIESIPKWASEVNLGTNSFPLELNQKPKKNTGK